MPSGEQLAVVTPADVSRAAAPQPPRRWIGWTLLVCWVLAGLGVVLLGERTSSYSRLESDVESGRVHAVRTEGGLQPEGRGFATVDVHWRRGLLAYSTSVIEYRPTEERIPQGSRDGVTAVINGDVERRLTAAQPGLRISRGPQLGGSSSDILGWRVGGGLALASFGLWLATVVTLALARTTWRATRWAWFWLCGLPPIGPIAYLVLGGPTRIGGEPRDRSRRLTGGWAFLIVLVLQGAFNGGG